MSNQNGLDLLAETPNLIVGTARGQATTFVAQGFPMRFAIAMHPQYGREHGELKPADQTFPERRIAVNSSMEPAGVTRPPRNPSHAHIQPDGKLIAKRFEARIDIS